MTAHLVEINRYLSPARDLLKTMLRAFAARTNTMAKPADTSKQDSKLSAAIDDAAREAKDTAHDAGRKAKDVAHDAKERAHDAGHDAKEKLHDAGHKLGEVAHDVGHRAKEIALDVARGAERATKAVQEKIEKLGN